MNGSDGLELTGLLLLSGGVFVLGGLGWMLAVAGVLLIVSAQLRGTSPQ